MGLCNCPTALPCVVSAAAAQVTLVFLLVYESSHCIVTIDLMFKVKSFMTCGNLASSSWLNSQCCDFCHLLDLVRGGLCSVDRSVVHFIQSNKRVQKLTSVNGPVPPLSLSAFM